MPPAMPDETIVDIGAAAYILPGQAPCPVRGLMAVITRKDRENESSMQRAAGTRFHTAEDGGTGVPPALREGDDSS
jgi:hypothetical protein